MEVLGRFWEGWKKFGLFIGNLVGRIFLTIFYFTIVVPFALPQTLFGDRLDVKNFAKPTWLARKTTDLTLDDARRLS